MQCRVAPSLGTFEGNPNCVWGTTDYAYKDGRPAVFFGLYGLPDFFALWRHPGKKYILWAGTDITHFRNGYWLEEGGGIRLDPEPLAEWIQKNCESWVENEVEREALERYGIIAQVCPSFLGDVKDYEVTYHQNSRPQVYASVSGDNFDEYGWEVIEEIADKCAVDFHLYGNFSEWKTEHHNVFVHGRVPKEKMNEDIKNMQAGLRLNVFDGFSEVLAKSVLWGQWPITWSAFGYKHIDSADTKQGLIAHLNNLKNKAAPNEMARKYYLANLNIYPWTK